MKRLHAFAIGLALGTGLVATQVHSAEPAVISFQAPTKYTTGEDIPAGTAISYNVYQGVQGQAKAKIATITTTGTTVSTGLVPGTTYCFAVTAVVAGVEGPQTPDTASSCKLTPLLVPGPIVVTVK